MPLDVDVLFARAAEKLKDLESDTRVRIASHYDADGASAAAIIGHTVNRLGLKMHASLMRNPFDLGLKRIAEEENDFVIFTDLGSGQLDAIEKLSCPTVILDHHQFKRESSISDIIQINANQCGIDGNYEACGATLAHGFAKAVDEQNKDLAVYGLVGAIGDKQHIGGLRGFNKKVFDEANDLGLLKKRSGVKLYGQTLKEALFFTMDPFYSGLSGDESAISTLLKALDVSPATLLDELSSDQRKKIESLLVLKHVKLGVKKNILETVTRERYYSEILGCEIERFADLLDACGKTGNRGLALAVSLDPASFFKQAIEVEKTYKTPVLEALRALDQGGVLEMDSFSYFYSQDSSLGGVIAGIAENFILTGRKPLIAIARKEVKNELHISSRGTQELVKKGLDLGDAMNTVAESLSGFGGGHKIAAGATIPLGKEKEFLEAVDAMLKKQLMK